MEDLHTTLTTCTSKSEEKSFQFINEYWSVCDGKLWMENMWWERIKFDEINSVNT